MPGPEIAVDKPMVSLIELGHKVISVAKTFKSSGKADKYITTSSVVTHCEPDIGSGCV